MFCLNLCQFKYTVVIIMAMTILMFAINVISGGRLKKGKKKSVKCIFHARQSLMSKSRSKVKVLIYMPLNEDF